jgi:hypothetical protein
MARIRPVHWTVLADRPRAVQLITEAAGIAHLVVADTSPTTLELNIPGRILKRRPAGKLIGAVTSTETGTEIEWTLVGLGSTPYEHLLTLSEQLPEGTLDDRGVLEAASRVGLAIFGPRQTRYLADVLHRNETVLAVGVGALATKAGVVVLTDRRLVFVQHGSRADDLVEFPVSSITALSPRTKRGGEGLTVVQSGTLASISRMGAGQADVLAAAFAELTGVPLEPAAATDPPPADPIAQIERLAELRDKGILSEEEFQAQKARLLSRL